MWFIKTCQQKKAAKCLLKNPDPLNMQSGNASLSTVHVTLPVFA